MVIQLSKLFRINVAGLLAADGVTLVLDETAGTELVTTLAEALGLTVGAGASVIGGAEKAREEVESAQVVDDPRVAGPCLNPQVGDYMWRNVPPGSLPKWDALVREVVARDGKHVRLMLFREDGSLSGECVWSLHTWMTCGREWTYECGAKVPLTAKFKRELEQPPAVVKAPDIITEAVAAAISAPAAAVKPTIPPPPKPDHAAGSKPLADRPPSIQRIHGYLTDYGAATINEIADDLGYDRSGLFKSLKQHPDLFAPAGKRAARGKSLKPSVLWDLCGRAVATDPVTCAEKVEAYLRTHKAATVQAMATEIGMSAVSVDNSLRNLHSAGTVEKCGRAPGRGSRPAALWRLKANADEKTSADEKAARSAPVVTIATVEAGQTVVVDHAPDFLPVAPADLPPPEPLPAVADPAVIEPAAKPKNATTGLTRAVVEWLRVHGPASYQTVAAALNVSQDKVRDVVRKRAAFIRIGLVRNNGRPVDVWGLAGVHKPVTTSTTQQRPAPVAVPTPAPAPVAQTRRPIKSSTAVRTDRFVDRLHKLLTVNGPRFADDLAFTTGEPLACVVTTLNAWESEKFNRTGRTIQTPGGLPRVEWEAISEAVG